VKIQPLDPFFSVLLVDDHLLFRREMRKIIEEVPGVKVIGEAASGSELLELLEKLSPDLILLDVSIPGLKAMEATQIIKKKYPRIKVLVMIMEEEREYLDRATAVGAVGVLLKQDTASEFSQAITLIRQGKNYIPKQMECDKSVNNTLAASWNLKSILSTYF
jgi:DNA-binding NarL/FixJ family response regulator